MARKSHRRQYRMTLVVAAAAMPAAASPDCLADFNVDGSSNTIDVIQFLNAWNARAATADYNGDRLINTQDVITFLNSWNAGCPPALFAGDPNPNELGEAEHALPGDRPGCGQRPTISEKLEHLISGVYPFSGETTLVEEDMAVSGRVLDVRFVRRYRSQEGSDSPTGNHWDHSYNISIQRHGPHINVHNGFGRVDTYRANSLDSWTHALHFRELVRNGDATFSLHFGDGGSWRFRALDGSPRAGKIDAIIDRNGNTIALSYDAQGRLTTLLDDLGRTYTIAYDGEGRIESICDFTDRCWTYAYYADGDPGGMPGDLMSVTTPAIVGTPNGNDFPQGRTVTYTYTTGNADDRLNHLLTTVRDARGVLVLSNEYDLQSDPGELSYARLRRQVLGDSTFPIDLVYAEVVPAQENNFASLRVIMNMRDGAVKEAFYNSRNLGVMLHEYTGFADPTQPTTETENRPGSKLRATDPDRFEHRWEYESSGLVRSVTFPSTGRIVRTHDTQNSNPLARGNLLQLRREAGPFGGDQILLIESFEYLPGYGSCCGSTFVTSHTDARGFERTFAYDARGNLITEAGPSPGDADAWEYDDFGRRTARIHSDNGQNHRQRDEYAYYNSGPMRGRLRSVTMDAGGLAITTTYEYDDLGRMTRAIDPAGNDTMAVVNALGEVVRELSQVAYEGGVRVKKDRFMDANGNIIRVDVENRDHSGHLDANEAFTMTMDYDELNRPIRTTKEIAEGDSLAVEVEYHVTGLVSNIRSGEAVNGNQAANAIERTYDERGKLYREVLGSGSPEQSTSQRDYNLDGFMVREVEGLEAGGREVIVRRDGFGRVTLATDAMGNRRSYSYDPAGNRTEHRLLGELLDVPGSAGNVLLHEQRTEFDEASRPVHMEREQFDPATGDPVGESVELTDWVYAPSGQLLRRLTPDGGLYELERDSAGRRVVERLPSGVEHRYAYNAHGQLILEEVAHPSDLGGGETVLTTLHEYDTYGRLTRTTEPGGGVWEYGWDSRDNRTSVRDPRGNTQEIVVDGAGRVTEMRTLLTDTGDGSGQVVDEITVRKDYDDSSRVVRRTDDAGRITRFEYDALDRTVLVEHADGTLVRTQYDAHHDITQTIDANGTVVDCEYDLTGRLVRRDVAPGQGVSGDTTFETFSYDGAGHMVAAANDATTVARRYDSLGGILLDTINGASVACVPDSDGLPLSCVYPSGRSFEFAYRPDGRAASVSYLGDVAATFAYLGGLGLEQAKYTDLPGSSFIDERTEYDPSGRFSRLTVVRDNGSGQRTTLDDRAFAWDATDNRTLAQDILQGGSGNTHEYSYDSANRLVRSDSQTGMGDVVIDYGLDGVGNRAMVAGGNDAGSYTADAMHQYTATPFDARAYDAMGNTRTVAGSEISAHISWDYRNQLVRWEDSLNGRVVSYIYDPLGRPVRRIETGPTPGDVRYRWLGDGLVEELNVANGVARSYVHAAGDLRLMVNNSGVFHLHPDQGATVFAITRADGAIVARYDYTDFGAPRNLMAPLVANTRLFAGCWLDPGLGLYRAGHRFFEARTGKFLSRDPLGVWADRSNTGNGSLYTGANPWSRKDPAGLTDCGYFGTPKEWMCYDFDDCTSSDEDDFHDYILGRTLAGVEDLEWDVQEENVDSLIEQWFDGCGGSVSSSEYADINDAIEDVELKMEDNTMHLECEYSGGHSNWCLDEDDGGEGYSAYVYGTSEVHLCDRYFDDQSDWDDADGSDNDKAQDTYYHELNHAYNNWGDQGYYTGGSGEDGCPNYTIDGGDAGIAADEDELRKNPDTYSSMARLANPATDDRADDGYFAPY